MKWLTLALCVIGTGCTVGPNVPKGEATIQGRGSEALTNEGDPLVTSGFNARQVPVEFAKGYTKGVSDQVKRTYWAIRTHRRLRRKIPKGESVITTRPSRSGKIPKVIRVQREVVIPIVE
jgi:hypothetical protein